MFHYIIYLAHQLTAAAKADGFLFTALLIYIVEQEKETKEISVLYRLFHCLHTL